MSEHTEYAIIPFLIEKGFDRPTAEEISEEVGIELSKDLPLIRKENKDEFQFLRPCEKEKLWRVVRDAFEELPMIDKERMRTEHWARYGFMRVETRMSANLNEMRALLNTGM
jgi:hypothetical protein